MDAHEFIREYYGEYSVNIIEMLDIIRKEGVSGDDKFFDLNIIVNSIYSLLILGLVEYSLFNIIDKQKIIFTVPVYKELEKILNGEVPIYYLALNKTEVFPLLPDEQSKWINNVIIKLNEVLTIMLLFIIFGMEDNKSIHRLNFVNNEIEKIKSEEFPRAVYTVGKELKDEIRLYGKDYIMKKRYPYMLNQFYYYVERFTHYKELDRMDSSFETFPKEINEPLYLYLEKYDYPLYKSKPLKEFITNGKEVRDYNAKIKELLERVSKMSSPFIDINDVYLLKSAFQIFYVIKPEYYRKQANTMQKDIEQMRKSLSDIPNTTFEEKNNRHNVLKDEKTKSRIWFLDMQIEKGYFYFKNKAKEYEIYLKIRKNLVDLSLKMYSSLDSFEGSIYKLAFAYGMLFEIFDKLNKKTIR